MAEGRSGKRRRTRAADEMCTCALPDRSTVVSAARPEASPPEGTGPKCRPVHEAPSTARDARAAVQERIRTRRARNAGPTSDTQAARSSTGLVSSRTATLASRGVVRKRARRHHDRSMPVRRASRPHPGTRPLATSVRWGSGLVEWYAWAGFCAGIATLFAVDLGLFHRRAGPVHPSQALLWSGLWMAAGLGFGLVVWAWLGGTLAGQYVAGYVIEWSLSVDNIFVFVLVFLGLAVPEHLRQRVLMLGVVGAVVLRLGFILGGAALLHAFSWMEYAFGSILVATAVRLVTRRRSIRSIRDSAALKTLGRVLPLTGGYRGGRFVVRENGRIAGTPLLAVLALLTVTDVIFAVDSIPAVYAVTQNAFVAFTSNALAVLGLRPLFFVLAGAVERFHYLKASLAAILGFVGLKLILHREIEMPTALSLAVIAAALGIGIGASWLRLRRISARRGAPEREPSSAQRTVR